MLRKKYDERIALSSDMNILWKIYKFDIICDCWVEKENNMHHLKKHIIRKINHLYSSV